MNDLQSKLLEMLGWFNDFCVNNHLRYYAIGGTFLGAVRHKGFIPWDDDVDVAMPREDYEKLISLLKVPIEHYVVESPKSLSQDYLYPFAKLYDINTTMTEALRKHVKRGVYIDIFPLDGIGNTPKESFKNYKKIDRYNMLLAMRTCTYRKGRKWWKNVAVFLGRLIPINNKKLVKKLDELCSKYKFNEYDYVGNLVSTYRSREIMEKTIFGKPLPYKFENLTIFGPEKYEGYLTHLFGNWAELPPEEKRCSAHDFIELDLNTSYLNDRKQ